MSDEPSPSPEAADKTRWHCLLGRLLEEPLTRLNVAVQTEVDVVSGSPKADIILIRRTGERWTEAQRAWLADGLRDSLARELLIEFKFSESLNDDALAQLCVNDHLYRAKQHLEPETLQSFLILSKTPRADQLARYAFHPLGWPGVYGTNLPLIHRLRLMVLNELADLPHNGLMKCFASRATEWRKGFVTLFDSRPATLSNDFDWILSGIRRLRMKGTSDNTDSMGWTIEAVMDLGRLAWFEAMMNDMPEEELFRFDKMARIREEGREAGRGEGEAKIILRQLTRRFGPLPETIRTRISQADDDMLERWGDRLLEARTLDEVFTGDPLPPAPMH
ncbi:MAG: DUF4351 domain-containing protein [Magnetococcus sp. YQC-9]